MYLADRLNNRVRRVGSVGEQPSPNGGGGGSGSGGGGGSGSTPGPGSGSESPTSSVTGKPVKGTPLAKLPGTTEFVEVTDDFQVVDKTVLDLRTATIEPVEQSRSLTSIRAAKRKPRSARFRGGIVKVRLAKSGFTELRLVGGDFGKCRSGQGADLRSPTFHRPLTKRLRLLIRKIWGKGRGKWRTRGRYSSTTVRGTTWVTRDICGGTETRLTKGKVSIWDAARRKRINLTKKKR